MRDLSNATIADCSCPLCRRAASLDAMRLIDAARVSAARAKPWPDEVEDFAKAMTIAGALSGLAWLALLVAACWLLARLS